MEELIVMLVDFVLLPVADLVHLVWPGHICTSTITNTMHAKIVHKVNGHIANLQDNVKLDVQRVDIETRYRDATTKSLVYNVNFALLVNLDRKLMELQMVHVLFVLLGIGKIL